MEPLDLVRRIATVCGRLKLEYYITGSMASTFFGDYRSTHDVDVVVELPSWKVKEFCAEFPEPDFYVDPDTAMRAAQSGDQFNIIHVPSALKIDVIIFTEGPFNESRLSRAKTVTMSTGEVVRFSSPEDIILKKLEFFREGGSDKHLRDICSVLRVQGDRIDRSYIDHWALRLGVTGEWQLILDRLKQPGLWGQS